MIIEWTAAMQSVYTQLENFSKYEPLTQPQKFWRKSANISARAGAPLITTSSKVDQKFWMTKTRSNSQKSQTAQKAGKRLVIKGRRLKESLQAKDRSKTTADMEKEWVPEPSSTCTVGDRGQNAKPKPPRVHINAKPPRVDLQCSPSEKQQVEGMDVDLPNDGSETAEKSNEYLLNKERREMWRKMNNTETDSQGSTICMEKIEENSFLCKVCKTFRGDEEMLFWHWVKDHELGANLTL